MRCLEQARTRFILLLALAVSLLLAALPSLDLALSRCFYGGDGFPLKNAWWVAALQQGVSCVIGLGLAAVLGLFAFNRATGRRVRDVDGRAVAYVLLALLLGSGVIVNGVLKSGFGRARPRNVVQFGGSQQFSPAFAIAHECDANCSFSSGDVAGAFFSLPLAYALFRKRRALLAAGAFGAVVAFARIASGAHFLSDTVVSFFVMWIVADVLHFYLLNPASRAEGLLVRMASGIREATQDGVLAPEAIPSAAVATTLE